MMARRTRKKSFLELEAPPPDLRDLPRFCHPRLAGQARPEPGLVPESALRLREAIFKDPMTTASALDRLVHHSVILDLNIPSYRMEQAKKKKAEEE